MQFEPKKQGLATLQGLVSTNQEYQKLPELDAVVVDSELKTKDELKPLEKIQLSASEHNIKINDPNPKCKKCFGRGYIGFADTQKNETTIPIVCQCIFPKEKTELDEEDMQVKPSSSINRRNFQNFKSNRRKESRRIKRKYKRIVELQLEIKKINAIVVELTSNDILDDRKLKNKLRKNIKILEMLNKKMQKYTENSKELQNEKKTD